MASTYVLYLDSQKTDHAVKGTSPTKALRELVELAGLNLASQTGRYGKVADGRSASALTATWGRTDTPDARSTRL